MADYFVSFKLMKRFNELSTPIDRASKLLFKMYPHVLIDLAFPDQKVELINVEENVEINLPTRPLDIVMTIRCLEPDGEWREKILHVEHYAHYKPTVPVTLFMYSAELTDRMMKEVVTIVLYTGTPPRKRPTNEYLVSVGGKVTNSFHFPAIWLADYEEEIRAGKLAPLAPFLLEIVSTPTEETLQTAKELASAEKSAEQRSLLLSLVALLAGRYFDKAYLHQLFRKEVEMLRTNTFFDDWWLEAEQKGEKRGEKLGEKRGEKKGIKKGKIIALREVILKLIESRFHTLSFPLISSVNSLGKVHLELLLDLVLSASTLQEVESAVAKMVQSAESDDEHD